MPSTRTTRAATTARTEILDQLKEDHKSVKKAYREFQKLDITQDSTECEALVTQVLDELTVHAALEEEILYPAARSVIDEEDLIDEAEVEHESMHTFIEQLREMSPEDEKYAARFTVLCEYVLHHVKEEENEMFPKLESVKLDWETLAAQMTARRAELLGTAAGNEGAEASGAEGEAEMVTADEEADTVGAAQAKKTPAGARSSSKKS